MRYRVSAFTLLFAAIPLLYMPSPSASVAPIATISAEAQPLTSFIVVEQLMTQAMSDRLSSLIVHYQGEPANLNAQIDQAFSHIFEKDNYLHYVTKSYQADYSYRENNAELRFSFTYWETKSESEEVEKNAPLLLEGIIHPNMTDVQKVRAIHDWIAGHVRFDESLDRHSAYSALVERLSVCQGYALLAYHLFTLAGVDSRIVEGMAGGEAHIWNMARLGEDWVHLDLTWDRAIPGIRGVQYAYLNVPDEAIARDHSWTIFYPKATSRLYAAK